MSDVTRIVRKTTDYSLFELSPKNRIVNIKRHKNLERSFRENGFLSCYPIIVKKRGDKYLIYDGQHRFTLAKKYNTPIFFVETNSFDENDIAEINNTQQRWMYNDFAESYKKQGKEDYIELLEFSDENKIPLHTCVALLTGTQDIGGNVNNAYRMGNFKIKNIDFATNAARIMNATRINPNFKCSRNSRLVRAIANCLNVEGFDVERMVSRIKSSPEKLINYSTKDDFVNMLESIYNHKLQSSKWFPLALEAKKKNQERSFGVNKK